jgi:GPH family glycoside/pentoside/hexuronide:cation symporter
MVLSRWNDLLEAGGSKSICDAMTSYHTTAPADRVPVTQKIAYGLGAVVTIVAVNSVVQLSSLFYVKELGVNQILFAYAAAFPRLWDAIIDPFIGNLSDNRRSRYGRRIPFLVVGGVLIGIAFWVLWTVPRDWDKDWTFAYFAATSLFFYTVVPVYAIPHGALGLEMTEDYHEKTSIFAYASFIGNVGALTLPWVYFLANRPIFQGDTVNGIKWVCLGMSVSSRWRRSFVRSCARRARSTRPRRRSVSASGRVSRPLTATARSCVS